MHNSAIEREIVQRENAYTNNEIENRRLEQLHTQLNSFNLQATLIVGFALGTLNADNLVAISDDISNFCMYKQPEIAGFYAILTIFSIGTCMSTLCSGKAASLKSAQQQRQLLRWRLCKK